MKTTVTITVDTHEKRDTITVSVDGNKLDDRVLELIVSNLNGYRSARIDKTQVKKNLIHMKEKRKEMKRRGANAADFLEKISEGLIVEKTADLPF